MTEDVLVERRKDTLAISLRRTKALNALTLPMIRALRAALEQAKERVVIRGDARAFCAGGDVRAVRDAVLANDDLGSREFFFEEYRLNAAIARFGGRWIALCDGIVMGGGLGISVHGSHRVVTERTVMAMPEMAIGMIPDIGATYFLSRLPEHVAEYIALTGARLTGADAIALGLATHYVPSDRIDALFADPTRLEELATPAPASTLNPVIPDPIPGASPTSIAITKRLLAEARNKSLLECLRDEYRAVRAVTWSHDFVEGIRAVLVDKTRDAHFSPVDPAVIDRAFAAPPEGDWTP